jgi:hypothetical protein
MAFIKVDPSRPICISHDECSRSRPQSAMHKRPCFGSRNARRLTEPWPLRFAFTAELR